MSSKDREYFRYRPRVSLATRWPRWLLTAGSVIAVASAGMWLLRDLRSFVPDSRPAEGSLIVNINEATEVELETIPGIGPARAAEIVALRPFSSVNDLVRVNGIGERQLASMRPFVTTVGETRKK